MLLGKLQPWDWFGIALSLVSTCLLWWLVRSSPDAAGFGAWVAVGPLLVGVVAIVVALTVSRPSRVMRVAVPLAIIANVLDIYVALFSSKSSTAGLGILVAPAIGVMALLLFLPVVWVVDWFYRAMLAGVGTDEHR